MTASPARTEEREPWMPSIEEIAIARDADADCSDSSPALEALIRRAARERAIEELDNVTDKADIERAAYDRLAALRAEREGADHD